MKKVRIRFVNGEKIRRFYIFNIPLFQYKFKKGRLKIEFCKKKKPLPGQRVFYLKVHRVHRTGYDCIQHWLDIIARMDAFVYFVCDNKEMREGIFKKPCFFYNENFDFIKSYRKKLKKQVKLVLHNVQNYKLWQRIAYSMLTPFAHAAKYGYTRTYNIDADDIMILTKPELVAEALKKAEFYAEEKDLDCFNFDMFVSKTFGVHWSFGVVYVRTPEKCLEAINNNIGWRYNDFLIEKYSTYYVKKFNFNVDWLFTFLRDTKQLKLETFYIENSMVIHMPDIVIYRNWAFALRWRNGVLYLPVLDKLYEDKLWGKLPIYNGCIKIDIGLKDSNISDFVNEFYSTTYEFENDILNFARQRNLISEKTYKNYMGKNECL